MASDAVTLQHGSTAEFIAHLSKEKPKVLDGHVFTAPTGTKGFDANTPVSPATAKKFLAKDFHFVYRYVSRVAKQNPQDLTTSEVTGLLGANMAVGVVQHVGREGWKPTAALGKSYGTAAADRAAAIGFPPGVEVVCDQEGVDPKVEAAYAIEYLDAWHSAVAKEGFVPRLYVGWHCSLSAEQLYALRFTGYVGAYNVDVVPATRGFMLKQSAYPGKAAVPGVAFSFDVDTVKKDKLGGLPTLFAAEGWLAGLKK